MSNIIQKTHTTNTNPETGEIIETTKEQTIRFPKTEDFVMTFTKELGFMKNLSKGEILLVFGFLKIVNRDNELILNKSIKERIAKEFDLSVKSINPLISNLAKKGVIINKERGIYLLNTFLFGKGSWGDIKELRMNIVWNFKEQTKSVSIEQEYLNEEELLQKQIEQQQEQLRLIQQNKKMENERQRLINFVEFDDDKR